MELLRHYLIISVISALLLAIALSFLVRFVLPALRIRKELQAAVKRLKAIKASTGDALTDLEAASVAISTSGTLDNSWQEYCETLHEQRSLDPSGQGTSVRWRSTTLAETFFTQQALVDTPLKTEFYKHLPGILTGLGIIGTFSGLITGLIRFEVSGNAEQVRASLNGLIQSVGYSFVVSALAITLAMVFVWEEKSLATSCYRQVEGLCRLIDGLFDTGAGEEYLARLVASSEASSAELRGIRDSLAGEFRQVIAGLLTQQMKTSAMLNKQFLAGIGESIRVPMERIVLAVDRKEAPPADALGSSLSAALDSFSSRMQDMLGTQFREMGGLLKETGRTLDSALRQAARCVEIMQSAGRKTEEAEEERMNRAISALDERQRIMDRSMGEFLAQTSQATLTQADATRNVQSALADISERMALMVERIEAGSRQAAEEFEVRQGRLAEHALSSMGEITGQLRSLVVEMRQAAEVTRDGTTNLSSMTKATSELIRAGREALQRSLNDFTEASRTMSATLQDIRKSSSGIQGASSNLATATGGVKDMLDEHRHTSEIFASIVSELKSTIENARHEASMTSEIVERIRQATQQLGLAQNKAGEYLHGLTEVLAQAHAEFAGNIELTLRKSNTQFHEELSRAVSLVSGAIQDFGDVLDAASMKDGKQCWV